MQFEGPVFVLAIIAMSYLAWIITTAIRAKHGYPIENEWGGRKAHRCDPDADKATKALVSENEQLKATVGQLEERLKVLERIAPTRRASWGTTSSGCARHHRDFGG